jgi:hypothetical protein
MLSPLRQIGFSCPLTTVRLLDRRMLFTTSSLSSPASSHFRSSCFKWTIAGLVLALCLPAVSLGKTKPRKAPRPEPELKILELKVGPNPYTISAGPLEFSALVQLPRELNGATLLEVSSLVSSPSKTSIRFLSIRKPLEPRSAPAGSTDRQTLSVVLAWDGMDHKKMPAEAGLYQYELRAKLLTNGEKGPRTQAVSWPKRGTVEVK